VKDTTSLRRDEFFEEKSKFLREKCSFSSEDMIVRLGKNGLSSSSRQLKLLLVKNMIVPQGKVNFPNEQ
jgi:hypothetical protein